MRKFFLISSFISVLGTSIASAQQPAVLPPVTLSSPAPFASNQVVAPPGPPAIFGPASAIPAPVTTPPIQPPAGFNVSQPLTTGSSLPPTPPPGFNVGQPVGSQPGAPIPGTFPSAPKADFVDYGPRIYGSFEYLLWFSKEGKVPPLVSAVSGPAASASPIDSTGGSILNSDTMSTGAHSGFRFTVGAWFDTPRSFGIEANYMWFVKESDETSYRSALGSVLGRPIIDAKTGRSILFPLSSPSGNVIGMAQTKNSFDVDGSEINAMWRSPVMLGEDLTVLAGFRYFGIEEKLYADGISRTASSGTISGTFDEFATKNNFYGGQVGLRWNLLGERWTADVTGKLAIGGMSQEVNIHGGTTVQFSSGNKVSFPGGLLALSSNSGTYDRTKLAFIPELSANLGYRVNPFTTVFVGYNFMYVSSVVRPGDQIDLTVNRSLLPIPAGSAGGAIRPTQSFVSESFWIQGINMGIAFRY